MAPELICETCGLAVPSDTSVCPRDGTVLLASFSVPASAEPTVVVRQSASEPPPVPPPAEPPRDPLIGMKLGEYELRSRIGVGGMGLVYDGIQPLIGKRVAVKVLRPELAHSAEQVARLLAEARAVNAIRHRGIIDIFGFGQVPDGRQYIVMEFLDGQPLDAVLAEKGRLPVHEALALLEEVLGGLAAAHGAGVVHRDLKPSNIFLVQQPDGSRYVKLLDFGLAKRGEGPTGRTAQTRTDMVVGTPEYMAPEQARGQEVGPMTDLYAMGVVTFEMVTGRLPFVGSSPVDLLMKHVEARPPRPSEFVPDLPPALDAFVLQMLTKDPETRPNSADTLRQQLQRLRRTLRATRTNPTAPAPTEPASAPARAELADSRRPTTNVPAPVPPELTTQEVRAVGRNTLVRRLLPAGLGAAALLAAVGVVAVTRGAGEGATAQAGTAAGGAQPQPLGAQGAPSGTAVGGAQAGAPTQVVDGVAAGVQAGPGAGGTQPGAPAQGGSAAGVQPGGAQAGAPTQAVGGVAPGTQAGSVQAGASAEAAGGVATGAQSAPGTQPGAPAQALAGASAPQRGVGTASTKPGAPSQKDLFARIRRLETRMNVVFPIGSQSGDGARNSLEGLRQKTKLAQDEGSRLDIASALNSWERMFLKKR
ncbi:serine/threonine-protein kinase [Citreicoccus inhibens]|uniref:serine/threonine-protein kinase n=1 Tax=Citreicoccus inhibens TaxID=2849499 RepID=UPI001F1C9645|nr:serine/threonine-protein kinase [Citreicoccus inhibens]